MEHVRAIRAVLAVNGVVPRRAVLLEDGGLADRTHHPDRPEAELVSRLCEIVRGASGVACYPRSTAALAELALRDNDPGAWQCVRDDLVTGDLDMDTVAAVLRQSANAAALIACFVGARDARHLVHVACFMARALDVLHEETRDDMGRAIACQLRAFMDALLAHASSMTRDVLEAVMAGCGKMLARVGLPDVRIADAVTYALGRRCDDLLRLFLHVPPTFADHRPHQVVPALVDRAAACRNQPHALYGPLALLARVVTHRPELVRGSESVIAEIACGALRETPQDLDCRECLAAATLVVALGECALPGLPEALARALQHCASALIRGAAAAH
jgi:hypothetical protein